MDIFEHIVGNIVDKYGNGSKRFITEKYEFLKIVVAEYTVITENPSSRTDMITNPTFLTTNVNVHTIEDLQKVITKHLFTKLYTNNIISESEYKELCKKEDV